MGNVKVCVYAICKDEEQFVDRWMDSMLEADLVVVTDTGSIDKTVEKLKKRGAEVYIDEIKPWRFDVARNVSLSHVPADVEICVCTDLDEIFSKGWRKCIEKVWKQDTNRGEYLYNWSLKEDGTPDVQFNYFKIHDRKNYIWRYPIHECIAYTGITQERIVYINGITLNHFPDNTKSRGSYLPLLEIAVEESPEDDRVNYYLGREYMYKNEWQKCINTLSRYLQLKSATWNEERCAAMRWIAASYYKLNNILEAYKWYYRAIAEDPNMREPYVECAKMAYELGDWNKTFYMIEEALKIKEKSHSYVNMGYAWDHTPDDLGAISCYRLGMYERSLAHAEAAVKFSPDDKRLQENLKSIKSKL